MKHGFNFRPAAEAVTIALVIEGIVVAGVIGFAIAIVMGVWR